MIYVSQFPVTRRDKKRSTQKADKNMGPTGDMEMFLSNIGGATSKGQKEDLPRYQRYKADVCSYLNATRLDKLFTYQAGRIIPSMREYHPVNNLTYDEAQQMKTRIISLNAQRDTELELSSPPGDENSV